MSETDPHNFPHNFFQNCSFKISSCPVAYYTSTTWIIKKKKKTGVNSLTHKALSTYTHEEVMSFFLLNC